MEYKMAWTSGYLAGRIGQPRRFGAIAPFGYSLAQSGIAKLLVAALVASLFQK